MSIQMCFRFTSSLLPVDNFQTSQIQEFNSPVFVSPDFLAVFLMLYFCLFLTGGGVFCRCFARILSLPKLERHRHTGSGSVDAMAEVSGLVEGATRNALQRLPLSWESKGTPPPPQEIIRPY